MHTPLKVSVRRAVDSDLPWLISELEEFAKVYETKHKIFPDENHAITVMSQMIAEHVVFVAEKDGELMGFIGGIVTPHFFNPGIITLAEMFWWVSKEHRGSRAGLLLLNEFIAWGKEHADWITVSLEAKSPVNEKALLKRGFNLMDRNFLLEDS